MGQLGLDGLLRFQGGIYRCAIGKGGRRADKREGDGATPVGLLPLRRVLYRADRLAPPRAAVPSAPVAPDDGWCDDTTHTDYNTQIRLPHPARHEELWRADEIYDVIGVLGWNDAPVARGRGSAIFLHLARPGFSPTEGCIALERRDLLRVLAEGLMAIEVMA
ncbi:MAG: L,D-transpeptidase family protein [Roseomonas sp.]|nr:L,D-transpeptidase family protein [Roseomonas sp.]